MQDILKKFDKKFPFNCWQGKECKKGKKCEVVLEGNAIKSFISENCLSKEEVLRAIEKLGEDTTCNTVRVAVHDLKISLKLTNPPQATAGK